MTKYFQLGIGLKWTFAATGRIDKSKAGLRDNFPNYADIAEQVYLQDYIQPVSCVIAETLAPPTQALAGTVSSGGITSVIAEVLAPPTQALAGTISIPAAISETLLPPVQALAGNASPPVSGVTFVVAEDLPVPTQALSGTATDPASGVTFIVAEEMPLPVQNIEIFDGYERHGTGAAGNYHDKDAPKFADPGRGTKYDPAQAPRPKRVVAQTMPAPVQGIKVVFHRDSEGFAVQSSLAPVQSAKAVTSIHGRRSREEDELLVLLLGAA